MNFLFEDEVETTTSEDIWHILSVDDEPSIHQVTELVLSGFSFENKKIKLSTADSASSAIEFLKKNSDVALVLLDIVMERDDAGFDVANYLREDINNHTTRIIIRTGQPGSFPEAEVIRKFDIDGFAEKTDLTTDKLQTIVYSALRSYRDIATITQCKLRLESLLSSMSKLYTSKSISQLQTTLKTEIKKLTFSVNNIYLIKRSPDGNLETIFADKDLDESLSSKIQESALQKTTIIKDEISISYHDLDNGYSLHLCLEPNTSLCDISKKISSSLAEAVYIIYNSITK